MVGRHQGGASTVTSFATYNGTLNRILPMDFPIIINWVSPLSFLGVLGVIFILFIFYLIFSMKFLCANRIAPDGTPRSAASHLGLCCLPMSHKRDARLK